MEAAQPGGDRWMPERRGAHRAGAADPDAEPRDVDAPWCPRRRCPGPQRLCAAQQAGGPRAHVHPGLRGGVRVQRVHVHPADLGAPAGRPGGADPRPRRGSGPQVPCHRQGVDASRRAARGVRQPASPASSPTGPPNASSASSPTWSSSTPTSNASADVLGHARWPTNTDGEDRGRPLRASADG